MPHGSHRLVVGSAGGAGDAGYGDGQVGAQPLGDTLGHGPRHRLAHGAFPFEHLQGNPQLAVLDVVVIGDHPAAEHVRTPRDGGQPLAHLAAGARLGHGQGHAGAARVFEEHTREVVVVLAETKLAGPLPDLLRGTLEQRLTLPGRVLPGGQAQVDPRFAREVGERNRSDDVFDVAHTFRQAGFADAGGAQHS